MAYKDPDDMRRYLREWYRARRDAWFAEHSICAMCKEPGPTEVDHIRPRDKTATIHWGWSMERLQAELAKCQALCITCHRAKLGMIAPKYYTAPIVGMHADAVANLAEKPTSSICVNTS